MTKNPEPAFASSTPFAIVKTGLSSEPLLSSLPSFATNIVSAGYLGSGPSFNPGIITSIASPLFNL